jgi:hypothetical protein
MQAKTGSRIRRLKADATRAGELAQAPQTLKSRPTKMAVLLFILKIRK